jgi:hypothetical protein
MKVFWEKHKHFKYVYFLKLSKNYFIAKIIKPAYHDKWQIEILNHKKDEEFYSKREAMCFVERYLIIFGRRE